MNFNNNLDFGELMMRYAIVMALGIIAGATRQYWMTLPIMMVFFTAIMGWCPIKEIITRNKGAKSKKSEIVHMHHHNRKLSA